MTARPQLAAALREIVGAAGLVEDPQGRAAYESGARYDQGRAALVVRPRTTAEVSAVVGWCVRNRVQAIPQGAATGLVGASTPDASGEQLVLSLDRLQEPLEVDVTNRTARVGAGVRLSTLNRRLERDGLFLPIDLGADPTLGGMAATNTGGARFLRYGDMRRQVLGLEVVLADEAGTVLELKGGLRKDNTGLDLRQLFVGAGGALGVITCVEVEVQHRPVQAETALVLLEAPEAALSLLGHFEREAGELLSAFEGMSGAALQRALAHAPNLKDPFAGAAPPPYAVLVEFSSTRAAKADEPRLQDLLADSVIEWGERVEGGMRDALFGRPEELWPVRHAIPEGLRASGRVIGFDLAFRRSDLFPFRRLMIERLADAFPEVAVCDFGHIADGGVHFNLVCDPAEVPGPERMSELRACVYDLAAGRFGGSFSGEHGLGRMNLPYYRAYTPAKIRALAGAVQAAVTAAPLGVVDYAAAARPTANAHSSHSRWPS